MMNYPDYPLYVTDFTGKAKSNKITREYYERIAGVKNPVHVLKAGPFFQNSVKLFRPNGEELVLGKHFEFFGIMPSLTAYVKTDAIGIFIKIIDPTVGDFLATYQVVGNFSIISPDFLMHIESVQNDSRPIYMKNIIGLPKWFPPTLHGHDIRYNIHSFQDIIGEINRINSEVLKVLPNRNTVEIEHFHSTIAFYVDNFKSQLTKYIKEHDSHNVPPYTNAHGLTAKQMDMELVDNFDTATYMQILEGIRHDLHITADLTKAVIDNFPKEADNLLKKGSIPVVRYGNNNFIPPGIDGSFEGMGGTNFAAGMGREPDGTWLILTGRADGRSSGLYFMRNLSNDPKISDWEFTAYKYIHPKAVSDGVPLNNIIRGSNQKFLIIGDGSNWYWTYGNGTFDPAKHQLNRLPAYDPDSNYPKIDMSKSYILTAGFPNKVYLLTYFNNNEAWLNDAIKPIAFEGYEGYNNQYAEPRTGDFIGFMMWELDVASSTWKQVEFNYSQGGRTENIKSIYFVPYRYTLAKGYQRADMEDYSEIWSITRARVQFKYGITWWNERWYNAPIAKYDFQRSRLAIKYFTTGYGKDQRNNTFEGYLNSFGISLEGFGMSNNLVTCNVNKGLNMGETPLFDNLKPGARMTGIIPDTLVVGYSGSKTCGLIADGIIYTYGTNAYGTFPAMMSMMNVKQLGEWENYDIFYKSTFQGTNNHGTSGVYNEVNPVGLTIGMFSDSYVLPDNNKPGSYGCISVFPWGGKGSNLIYRKMAAMNSSKNIVKPPSVFNIFDSQTEGYPLSNDVRMVDEDYFLPFNTMVPLNTSNAKDRFHRQILSHSTVKRNSPNNGSVNNSNANHLYYEEVSMNMGTRITFNFDKIVNLETIVKGALGDKLKAYVAANAPKYNIDNYVALYSVIPTGIESNLSGNIMIFNAGGFDPDGRCAVFSIAFYVTKTSKGDDGIWVPTEVTFIGDFVKQVHTAVRETDIANCRTAGSNFNYSKNLSNIAPRNIQIQQKDGSSVVVWNAAWTLNVTGNLHRPGAIYNVNPSTGITDVAEWSNYWTAGEYKYIPHPYYGVGTRAQPTGAANVGRPYVLNADNNYGNIKNRILDNNVLFLSMNNYIEGAFTVYFKGREKVTVGGIEYILEPGYIDLYDIDSSPGNKTFYCYLAHGTEGVRYVISQTGMAETYSQALIAIIKTNANGIYEIRPQNVFSMNGFRISAERHGSVIPMATGSIKDKGQTSGWADNDADLG